MPNAPESPPETSVPVSNKERLKLIFKFAVVVAIFWLLFRKGLVTASSFTALISHHLYFVLCILLMILNTVCGALRWQVLLQTQGAPLPFRKVLQYNLIGAFFNIALPGAVSGDFIKAVYVAKKFRDQRAGVFGSMLLDRVLGVSAMALVAAVSAIVSLFIPWGGSLSPILLYLVGGIGACVVFFYVYLFLSHTKDPLFQVLRFVTKRHHKLEVMDRLYLSVMSYRVHPRRILKALALSVAIHFIVILVMFLIASAIWITPIPFIALAVIVPIGFLATAIPILPAGVGTGHAAYYALFKLVGSSQGAEIFSLFLLFQIAVGVWGGIVYLRHKGED
jgi:uncharacterized protein (TIRG00374 family)